MSNEFSIKIIPTVQSDMTSSGAASGNKEGVSQKTNSDIFGSIQKLENISNEGIIDKESYLANKDTIQDSEVVQFFENYFGEEQNSYNETFKYKAIDINKDNEINDQDSLYINPENGEILIRKDSFDENIPWTIAEEIASSEYYNKEAIDKIYNSEKTTLWDKEILTKVLSNYIAENQKIDSEYISLPNMTDIINYIEKNYNVKPNGSLKENADNTDKSVKDEDSSKEKLLTSAKEKINEAKEKVDKVTVTETETDKENTNKPNIEKDTDEIKAKEPKNDFEKIMAIENTEERTKLLQEYCEQGGNLAACNYYDSEYKNQLEGVTVSYDFIYNNPYFNNNDMIYLNDLKANVDWDTFSNYDKKALFKGYNFDSLSNPRDYNADNLSAKEYKEIFLNSLVGLKFDFSILSDEHMEQTINDYIVEDLVLPKEFVEGYIGNGNNSQERLKTLVKLGASIPNIEQYM